MKILMVSIVSPHFIKWTAQLKNAGHEIYWLDIYDSNTHQEKLDFVKQIHGWRYRWNYPGRYFVKGKFPRINQGINKLNERTLGTYFQKLIDRLKPDVVHSFVMQLGCYPLLATMTRYPQIKWVYSSWGSDLYFYQNSQREKMAAVLERMDYVFTDCRRDQKILDDLGFKGTYLGVYPGGGGYDFSETDFLLRSFTERKLILVKGYQGKHGRALEVLEGLKRIRHLLDTYQIVVFGVPPELREVFESQIKVFKNVRLLGQIPHKEVMQLMGAAAIYVGNSLSDGTPNTLLEAFVMEAYPIQSNPGGVTEEWIIDGKNGQLIRKPENSFEISTLLEQVLADKESIRKAVEYNTKFVKPKLERNFIQEQVVAKYRIIENNL